MDVADLRVEVYGLFFFALMLTKLLTCMTLLLKYYISRCLYFPINFIF